MQPRKITALLFVVMFILMLLPPLNVVEVVGAPETTSQVLVGRGANWDEYDNGDGTFTRVIYSTEVNIFDGQKYRPFTEVVGLAKTCTFNEILTLSGLDSTTTLTFSTEVPSAPQAPDFVKLPITPALGFNTWINDSNGGYKWGYNLQLPNSRFRGVVDVVSTAPLEIFDNDTWVDGMRISFKDVIEHNYTYTVERVNDSYIRYVIVKDFGEYGISVRDMIEIDPSVDLGQGTADDSYISAGAVSTNYGSETYVVAGTYGTAYRSIHRFDLSSLPVGSLITLANLYLYQHSAYGSGSYQFDIHRVDHGEPNYETDWIEAEVTWNDYKSGTAWGTAGGDFDATPTDITDLDETNGWKTWDVTSDCDALEERSWILKRTTEPIENLYRMFYTKEYTTNTSLRPYLNVTYSVEEEAESPSIFLLSQNPSELYANTTGIFNVTCGISHGSGGLNNTTIAFIYTTYNADKDTYNHSIRTPDNTKAEFYHAIGEYILRADNRNETLNFEDNATITGGNIYEWGGGDENTTRLTVEVINDTYTMIHWNGTVYDTVFPSMWYLDRTDIQETEKTQYPIDLSSSLITKIWDLEKIEKESGYIISILVDTNLGAELPIKPLEVYYMNESYDPTGIIDPVDSPFAFYLTSFNATNWIDHIYEPHINSSYTNVLFINETTIKDAGVNVTNTGWIYFRSKTPAIKPYYINVTNAPSSTNRTFGQTNVAYIGTSAPFTPYAYTPNIFLDYTHDGHQFKMQLYVADNDGLWSNSTIQTTDIGTVLFPPTTPVIDHFHYPTINDTDYDMNGMYRDTFLIGIGVATDPDGGIVTHNLTLHYSNGIFVAVINNTFTDADLSHGIYAGIEFNSTPYYSTTDEYTMRVIATDDENETSTMWLMTNFSLWTGEYTPPNPTNLTATITNDYIKYEWQKGIGNITSSYNVSINDTWYNETIEPYIQISTTNNTTYNISVWAFNNGGSGTLSTTPISLIKSITIIKEPKPEVPTDYSTIQSLSILLIFLCVVSLKLNSHLLSFCTTIISWYLAFNFIETPLLAIFFAIIGLVYLLNPLLWLGEK